jgi:hypothetical protein
MIHRIVRSLLCVSSGKGIGFRYHQTGRDLIGNATAFSHGLGRNASVAMLERGLSVRPSRKGDGVDGPRRHRLCQNEVVADLKQREPSVEQISRIGMDTSKHFSSFMG